MKCCCVILACNDLEQKYPIMVKNSIGSFKKWHPDVELIVVNERVESLDDLWIWRVRYLRSLFDKGYTKVICLGADTITCNKLDEFFEDDSTSFLATSDVPCVPDKFVNAFNSICIHNRSVLDVQYINSDVSCFNNMIILDELIKCMEAKNCHDNDAMNYLNCDPQHKKNIKIVDFPYTFKTFTYNLRGFGLLLGSDCIREDGVHFGFDGPLISIKSPLKAWTVSDNKLYNQDGKHVKCIHFASYKNQMDTLFSKEVYDWFEKELNVFI